MQKKGYEELLQKAEIFYQGPTALERRFYLRFYLLPPHGSDSLARSLGDVASIGVRVQQKDWEETLAVTFHEICHALDEKERVPGGGSAHEPLAYGLLDEALATAIGNGWAYEKLSGHMDRGRWYNSETIDVFAHDLFERVRVYLDEGRMLDQDFLNEAVRIYAKRFPDAHLIYEKLLTKIVLQSDHPDLPAASLIPTFLNHFHLSAAEFTDTHPQRPLIIVSKGKNCLRSYLNEKGRAVIEIRTENEAGLDRALNRLKKEKRIKPHQSSCKEF
jgi:hypothetical protein